MKKNKILYILTIIISLFTFNINVNAAQGLTCVYKKGGSTEKIILIQDDNGKREIWTNYEDASIESIGWEKKYIDDLTRIQTNEKDASGNLKNCPNYANAPTFESKVDFFNEYDFWEDFFSINKWFPQELDVNSSLDYVKRPTMASTTEPENTDTSKGALINIEDLDKSKYQATCMYRKAVENGSYHYVQLIYGKDSDNNTHINFTEFDPEKGKDGKYSGMYSGGYTEEEMGIKNIYSYSFKVSPSFTAQYFINEYSGECPQDGLVVDRNKNEEFSISDTEQRVTKFIYTTVLTQDEISADKGIRYNYVPSLSSGTNPVTGDPLTNEGIPNVEIQFEKINVENCTDLVGAEIAGYFKIIWNLVKIGVPIILIGLGTIDFVQAIFAGKEDEMKKAQTKFIKRIIIAAIIYLVPTLLGFLLKIANSVWSNIGTDICGIIF